MPNAIVIAIILSGIGCHNECSDVKNPAPACSTGAGADAYPCPNGCAPAFDYAWHSRSHRGYDSSAYSSRRAAWRSTLWSFVLGHDPDMPSVRDIEESAYSR
jgi:hypothetical protein